MNNTHTRTRILALVLIAVGVLVILFSNLGRVSAEGTQQIFLTAGSTWTVPADWNSADNKIEVIGGGGGGSVAVTGVSAGSGGGGGAYAKATNVPLTPSATVSYQIGAGGAGASAGGDTYFCSSTANCGSIGGGAVVVGGNGGGGGSGSTGGAGGSAAGSVGAIKNAGGAGGNGVPLGQGGAGGGAAGSPTGVGANGVNTAAGANGSAGGGPAGGAGGAGSPWNGNGANGGAGGGGTQFDSTHGSGSGGGGAGGTAGVGTGGVGGTGGNYGGGGGGGGYSASGSNGAPGSGRQGIIAITYTATTTGGGDGGGSFGSIPPSSVLGNVTTSSAEPAPIVVGSCNGPTNALTWTPTSGFGCNTITGNSGGTGSVHLVYDDSCNPTAYKPDGTLLGTAGTVTRGLQEAINYAEAKHAPLVVDGCKNDVIIASPLDFGSTYGQHYELRGLRLKSTAPGYAVRFDAPVFIDLDWSGFIEYGGSGDRAILFQPRNFAPSLWGTAGSGKIMKFGTIKMPMIWTKDSAASKVVVFDPGQGAIVDMDIHFDGIHGNCQAQNGIQVVNGAPSAGLHATAENHINFSYIGAFTNVGLMVGSGPVDHQSFPINSSVWTGPINDDCGTVRAYVETYAQHEQYQINSASVNLGQVQYGIIFNGSAGGNIATMPQLQAAVSVHFAPGSYKNKVWAPDILGGPAQNFGATNNQVITDP